jgi:Ca-activated chloride channel family protein
MERICVSMFSRISLLRAHLSAPLAVAIALGSAGALSFAQTPAPGGGQTLPASRSQANQVPAGSGAQAQPYDPTRPEAQPNLSLDHDPILSPDPDDNLAINPAAPVPNESPGALKKGQNGVYTLHQDVDEVLLNCTVIDENGKPVMDLKQQDFRVWEDGVPQATNSFQHQDLPVSMGIVVDNSGSMRDKRSVVNSAALDLLRSSNPKDSAFIVNFSDRASPCSIAAWPTSIRTEPRPCMTP